MNNESEKRHTTVHEITYLKNIGGFKEHPITTKKEKIEMLKKYIIAQEKKSHWGQMSKEKVLDFAQSEIVRLEGKKK